MLNPAVEQELHKQLKNLPLGGQRQVLDFARALSLAQPQGVSGAALLPFAGTIEPDDLAIMAQAVDVDCEQMSTLDW